ncbi:MAG: Gordonia phage Kenna [Actinomycetota bacterium]
MTPRGNPVPDTLFVFIDESGNFDFSDRGTRFFVMAGIAALAPLDSAAEMQALRYQLLAEGFDISGFHAAEDRQFVRNRVFEALQVVENIQAHVIYGEKKRAAQHIQSDSQLHALFGQALIRYFLNVFHSSEYQRVVVVFDQALTKKRQGDFHGVIKPELKALRKPFHLYFQKMVTDMNGQIADYVAWSKYVQMERNEDRPWLSLSSSLKPTDFNIFEN